MFEEIKKIDDCSDYLDYIGRYVKYLEKMVDAINIIPQRTLKKSYNKKD